MQQSDNTTHSPRTHYVRSSGRVTLLGLAGLSWTLSIMAAASVAHLHFN